MSIDNAGADAQTKTGWAERIKAALESTTPAAYSDLEEGLACLLHQNKELKEKQQVLVSFSQESQELISTMAIARHFGKTDTALAALDAFMNKRVIIKEVPGKETEH